MRKRGGFFYRFPLRRQDEPGSNLRSLHGVDRERESEYNGGMKARDPVLLREFEKAVGRPMRTGVGLDAFSSFRLGGPADYFFSADSEPELTAAVRFARARRMPFYLIGGGYNLLFDDAGFRGLILRNRHRSLHADSGEQVSASSGTRLEDLTRLCLSEEIGGLEFLAGIPGTIGGAVFGNAGAFGWAVGDVLESARILTSDDGLRTVGRDYFEFDYRWSRLKRSGDVLLDVRLRGRPGAREAIESLVSENLARRAEKHPCRGTACAGSYFKNPVLPSGEKVPAAVLLDQVGAKSRRKGGAAVFPGHANFIINTGSATSRDVRRLADDLKRAVEETAGVRLEEEVIYLPADPPTPE